MSSIRFARTISEKRRAVPGPVWFAVALIVLAGCVRNHQVGLTQAGAPRYEQVALVYDLTGAHGALEHSRMRTVGASSDETSAIGEGDEFAAVTPEPAWLRAQLTIEYPHPDGHAEVARATLQLSRHLPRAPEPTTPFDRVGTAIESWITGREDAPSAPVFPRDEIWSLDIPQHQLDLLLVDLADSGLFDSQQRPEGGSRIVVRVDQGTIEKPWTPEPRLDDIVTRVYRQGRFEGFADPLTE